MASNFIMVKCISGVHIIRISEILTISPKSEGLKNISEITIRKGDVFHYYYSTETQEDIYLKILENEQQTK